MNKYEIKIIWINITNNVTKIYIPAGLISAVLLKNISSFLLLTASAW